MKLYPGTHVKLALLDSSDSEDFLVQGETGVVIKHEDYDPNNEETVYVDFGGLRKWMNVSQLTVDD